MTGSPTSAPGELASESWLVVLPPEVPGPVLERLCRESGARGWHAGVSPGSEEAVVALAAERARAHDDVAAELAPLLAGLDADLVPLFSAEHYARLRRRRRLLSSLVTGLGLLSLAGVLLPLLAFLRPPPSPIVAPDLVRVAAASEIALGAAVATRFRDQPIFVIRVAEGAFEAVTARCTYSPECLLTWDRAREELECACHGCRFDAHGNVLHPPASIPLSRLEAFESEGSVFVRSRT